MSPTSKSRKRKRRAQLVASRSMPVGEEAWWIRFSERTKAEEFDDWMLAYWSARVLAVLLVLACGAMAILAVFTVRNIDDLHAYENAPVCQASDTTTNACRQEVSVVITSVGTIETGSRKDRTKHYYVDVSGLPQTPERIELHDDSSVWAIAAYGDEALVELWHGTPVAITDGYLTSETMVTPRGSMVDSASLGPVSLAVTVTLALNWLRLRDARRNGPERWPRWLLPLGPTMILVTLGFGLAAGLGSTLQSVLATVVADGAITLLVSAIFAVVWWRARTRRT